MHMETIHLDDQRNYRRSRVLGNRIRPDSGARMFLHDEKPLMVEFCPSGEYHCLLSSAGQFVINVSGWAVEGAA